MIKNVKIINDVRALIGKPKHYPAELVELLITRFQVNKKIKNAYLACIQYIDTQEQPHLVIGINSDEKISDIVALLEKDLDGLLKKEQVDFVDAALAPFAKYFEKIKPFYSRQE